MANWKSSLKSFVDKKDDKKDKKKSDSTASKSKSTTTTSKTKSTTKKPTIGTSSSGSWKSRLKGMIDKRGYVEPTSFGKANTNTNTNKIDKSNTIISDYVPGAYEMTKSEYNRRRQSNPSLPEFGSYEYFKNREESLRAIMDEIASDMERKDDTKKAWVDNYLNDKDWLADADETTRKNGRAEAERLHNKFKYQDEIIAEYKNIDTQLKKFETDGVHKDKDGNIDTKSGSSEAKYARERYETILSADALTTTEMGLGFKKQLSDDKQKKYDQGEEMAKMSAVEYYKEKAYNDYEKDKDNIYEDNLGGRASGGYKLGRIGINKNNATSASFDAGIRDLEAADVYTALSERIQKNNNKTFQNNTKGQQLLATLSQYAPQAVDQLTYEVLGIGVGLATGTYGIGNLVGSTGSAGYMYRQTAGASFERLLRESELSVEDAKKLAGSEALGSSAVEFGLSMAVGSLWNAGSWATKGATKRLTSEFGEKAIKRATDSLISKGITEKGANIIVKTAITAGKVTLNATTEGAEEWIQEGMSIATDKYAKEGKTASAFDIFLKSLDVSQYSEKELGRMNQSFLAGAVIGLGHGGLRATIASTTDNTFKKIGNAIDTRVLGQQIINTESTQLVEDAIDMIRDNASAKESKAINRIEADIANGKQPSATDIGIVVKSALTKEKNNKTTSTSENTEDTETTIVSPEIKDEDTIVTESETTTADDVSTVTPTVSVGDRFRESGTNNVLEILWRGDDYTGIVITKPNGEIERIQRPNHGADTLAVNDKYTKITDSETDTSAVAEENTASEQSEPVETIKPVAPTDRTNTSEMPTVSVGDSFIDKKTNNILKIVGRDNDNTTIELVTPKGKVETMTHRNSVADRLAVDDMFTKVETSVETKPVENRTFENVPATNNVSNYTNETTSAVDESDAEVAEIVDAIDRTLLPHQRDQIIQRLERSGYRADTVTFAKALRKTYKSRGNLGSNVAFFTDNGTQVISAIKNTINAPKFKPNINTANVNVVPQDTIIPSEKVDTNIKKTEFENEVAKKTATKPESEKESIAEESSETKETKEGESSKESAKDKKLDNQVDDESGKTINEGNVITTKKDDASFKSKSETTNDSSSLGETSSVDSISQNNDVVNRSVNKDTTSTETETEESIFIDDRTWDDVSSRKVKAFQYENPEVKPFYKTIARELLSDIKNTTKGERIVTGTYETGKEWSGTKRLTSESIARIKDVTGASYDKITDALNRIINDSGQENIALAKKIELVIDDMLSDGYTSFDGETVPANEEYLDLKESLLDEDANESADRYSISADTNNDIQTEINQSMTMEQAKDMIQRAFVIGGIKEWFDGEYKNGDEWLKGEGADAVALVVENEWTLQQKFLDKVQGVLNGDFFAEDIIEAYEKGTLTGKVKQNVVKRIDTSKSANVSDTRVYAPKDIQNAQEVYKVALERVTNSNRAKVYQARADIIMFAHNRGAAEALGITQSELNKKLSNWARYTARAKEASMRINKDVAFFNKWTGIENSNILNRAVVSQDELNNLVNEVKGDSNGWQRSYIMRTMLALDTHIDYSELNFEFVGTPKTTFGESVNGLYDNSHRKITVKYNAPHTVSHEMGHFIDYQWARDLGCSGALTDGFGRDKQTDTDVKQFLTNFDEFIEQIENSADLRSEYTMDRKEVFARFVSKFVQWVDVVANGKQSYAQEYLSYNDKFTTAQYVEFVRLLQEKSMIDSKNFETNKTKSTKPLETKPKEEYNNIPKKKREAVAMSVVDGTYADDEERLSITADEATITEDDISVVQSIGRKSINELTDEELKKLEKFERIYQREMGKKSPLYRVRYGDWRATDDTPISISVYDANAEIPGAEVINKDNKIGAFLGSLLKSETTTHAKGKSSENIRLKMLSNCKNLFENSILLDSYVSTPGGNKSNHTAFMHTFYGVFEIDKKRYLYKLFVEEFLNDGNIQRRGYEIKDIKIVPTSSSESDADASFSQPVNIDTIKSVADLFAFVKMYDKSFNPSDEAKLSLSKDSYAPTFYSKMGKVIDEIKQDKIGANSVASYLKGKGVKNEEIKWSGIEEFLAGKKSVTKAELQEFVAGSMLQIEETVLDGGETITIESQGTDTKDLYVMRGGAIHDSLTWNEVSEFWESDSLGYTFLSEESIRRYYGDGKGKTRWGNYKLDGGENYQEITFKMPNSTYTNSSMKNHWGENAEGIIAHARIQDFEVDGKKMLFIEEIQSDWHNAGQKFGYKENNDEFVSVPEVNHSIRRKLIAKYAPNDTKIRGMLDYISGRENGFYVLNEGSTEWIIPDEERILSQDEFAYMQSKREAQKSKHYAPNAPFRNNYHEYVLKNLIRMAAEQGYDSIGWTTADIQSKRWSEQYAEGYRIEYDQEIPKFLSKYGKKWGAKVGKTEIGKEDGGWYEVEGDVVWSMPITDAMKQSVLYEGQALYSLEKEGKNHEQRNGRRSNALSENSRRTTDESSRKQTERIQEFKQKNKGKKRTERKSITEEILAKGQTEEVIKGKYKYTLVKSEAYNDDMLSLVEEAKSKGIELGFFVGNAKVKFDSKNEWIVNGIKTGKSKILVQYDGLFSPQQIFLHELGHAKWNTTEMQQTKDAILNSLSEDEKSKILSMDRYADYMELYNGNEDIVWEEFVVDMLAGMNTYTADYIDLVTEHWAENNVAKGYNTAEYATSTDAGGRLSLEGDDIPNLFDLWGDVIEEFGIVPKGEMPVRSVDANGEIIHSSRNTTKKSNTNPGVENNWTTERVVKNKASKDKKSNIADIVQLIKDNFDIPITTGKVTDQRASGIYKERAEAIRTRIANDFPTISHELGHHLNKLYGLNKLGSVNDLRNSVSQEFLDQYADDEKNDEAIAEFVRTYLKNTEDAKKLCPDFYYDFISTLTKDDLRVVDTIANVANEYMSSSFSERVQSAIVSGDVKEKTALSEKAKRWHSYWVDSFLPIKDVTNYVEKITNSTLPGMQNAYMLATNSLNARAIANFNTVHGFRDLNGNIVNGAKSYIECIANVKRKDLNTLDEYLVLKHSLEWIAEQKTVFADATIEGNVEKINERIAEIEKKHPEMKKAADNLYEYQRNILKHIVMPADGITEEMFNLLNEKYPCYVPFYRATDKNGAKTRGSFANQKSPIEIAKGGGELLISPLESIIRNTDKMVKFALRNQTMQVLANYADTVDGFGKFMEAVPPDMLPRTINVTNLKDTLYDAIQNVSLSSDNYFAITEEVDNVLGDSVTGFTPVANSKKKIVTVLRNGEFSYYQIHDADLYNSIAEFAPKNLEGVFALSNKLMQPMKLLITQNNPVFAATNAIRDIGTAYKHSPINNPLGFAAKYIVALKEVVTNGDMYKQYQAMGGGHNSELSANIDQLKRTLKSINDKDKGKARRLVSSLFFHPISTIATMNDFIESTPRVMEFTRTLKSGGDLQEAIYNADDITTNFKRSGSGSLAKDANALFMFNNAALQGLDKTYRTLSNKDKSARTKSILKWTLSALILASIEAFWNKENDEEGYNNLSSYKKNNFYNISIGDGEFISIPKARETAMLDSFTERTIEYAFGNDKSWDDFGGYVLQQLLPPMLPETLHPIDATHDMLGSTVLGGIADIGWNKNFMDVPIESDYEKSEPSKERYNESTTKLGYALGQTKTAIMADMSPKKIDHLISSYTGIIGQMNKALFPMNEKQKDKTIGLRNKFVTDSNYSTDLLNKAYDNRDKAKLQWQYDNNINNAVEYEQNAFIVAYISGMNKAIKALPDDEQRDGRKYLLQGLNDWDYDLTEQQSAMISMLEGETIGDDCIFVESQFSNALPSSSINWSYKKQKYTYQMTPEEYTEYIRIYLDAIEEARSDYGDDTVESYIDAKEMAKETMSAYLKDLKTELIDSGKAIKVNDD